jgi:alkylhydroperoxidase family enzyme
MSRIRMVQPEEAPDEIRSWYDVSLRKTGTVPNVLKVMANAPVVLRSYMNFNSALENGLLPAELQIRIGVAVSQFNKCHY